MEEAKFEEIKTEIFTTRDYHTKRSKSEREKQIPYANTYMWNLKRKKMVMKNLGARRE